MSKDHKGNIKPMEISTHHGNLRNEFTDSSHNSWQSCGFMVYVFNILFKLLTKLNYFKLFRKNIRVDLMYGRLLETVHHVKLFSLIVYGDVIQIFS